MACLCFVRDAEGDTPSRADLQRASARLWGLRPGGEGRAPQVRRGQVQGGAQQLFIHDPRARLCCQEAAEAREEMALSRAQRRAVAASVPHERLR
jgi:hypothetical protein